MRCFHRLLSLLLNTAKGFQCNLFFCFLLARYSIVYCFRKRDNAASKLKGNVDRVRLLSTQTKAPELLVGVSEPFIGVKIPSPEVDSELPVQVVSYCVNARCSYLPSF